MNHATSFGWDECTSLLRIVRKQRYYWSLQFQSQDVSNKDMNVTEVIKVMHPNYISVEDKTTKAATPKASSEEGWSTVTQEDR